MSNIEVILGVACVILIWIAHATHKRAKEDEKLAKSRIDYLLQERNKYRTEAGYKLSLDLKYEQERHKYDEAEERYNYLNNEYNKLSKENRRLNCELSVIRTMIADSIEEQEECRRILQSLEEQKQKYWERAEEWAKKRIEQAKLRILQEQDDDINAKIAGAWADYKCLIYTEAIKNLRIKSHPISIDTAEKFKSELKQFKEDTLVEYKLLEYKYDYLLSLFPDLEEYIDRDSVSESNEEIKEEYEDRRIAYLSREEWESLSDREKSQRALDKYNEGRRLSNAQVGRDYEEYVAYLFRDKCRGAEIMMYGEQKGLADLGRDLIVKYKGKVYIVQCKRWSQEKVIREKHIMQLFGTTIEYCWEMKNKDIHPLDVIGKSVIPVFVTTTELSPTANRFAERLGVIVHKVPMGDFPQIKCNIGKDGERIYHLPFDQQYNSTLIEHKKGEFMAWTVEEAEKNGFRRALRHYIS